MARDMGGEHVGCHIDQEEYFKKEGVASYVEFC